jgi:hypothetical protein
LNRSLFIHKERQIAMLRIMIQWLKHEKKQYVKFKRFDKIHSNTNINPLNIIQSRILITTH